MSEEEQQEASLAPSQPTERQATPVIPAPKARPSNGAPLGVLLGAGIATLGISIVPGLIALLKKKSKKNGTAAAPEVVSAVPPVHLVPQLRPFGSPVDRLAINLHSPEGPGTPTMKQVESDTVAFKKDQEPQVPAGDTATLQKQLQMLKAMEEENAKLRSFMNEHLQASAKVNALEEENRKLNSMKEKLETELGELKSKPFVVNTGEDLQTFKGMLAGRLPLEARSVCSDAEGFGGLRGDAASVDGAATVAGFAAVSKRNSGFLNDLAQLLMFGTSTTSTSAKGKMSRESSTAAFKEASGAPLGATSPIPSRRNTGGVASADVGQLLDAWTGRL